MPEANLIEIFIRPLQAARMRYIVTGSVAATLYGEPRFTNDIDLVLFLRNEEVPRLSEFFPIPAYYVPPTEVILQEIARPKNGHFNIVHTATSLKADFYAAGQDPLHAWAFSQAKQYQVGGIAVQLAPAEYVILRKLEFFREGGSDKHLRDIRAMLHVSRDSLQPAILNEWIERLDLKDLWRRVSS